MTRVDGREYRYLVGNSLTADCRHCGRTITYIDGAWVDEQATGDDSIWRETCDGQETFTAEHEPS